MRLAACLALAAAVSAQGQIQYLNVSNPGEDDKVGAGDPLVGVTLAMSADGNTLAVSSPHEDGAAVGVNGNQHDESAWDAGAAYVFVRTHAVGGSQGPRPAWTQQAYIKASNTQTSDRFGFAIALSGDGNTLAVGATLEDSAARAIGGDQRSEAAQNSGAVYVFARRGTAWSQQAYIKASNADAGDQFGWSVSLNHDGTTLAVGAQSEAGAAAGVNGNQGDNAAPDAGAAYVFVRRGTAWSQQAYVKPLNPQANDRFGFCVALSGDGHTLGVCGYDEDGGATGVNGVPDERAPGSGCAYVFVRRGRAWSQEAYVKASNTTPNAAFGSAIVLSGDGNTLAVSAADEDSLSRGIDGDQRSVPIDEGSAGAVYVFARENRIGGSRRPRPAWVQQAYIKSSNIGPFDLFGIRLALTHDGNVMAAGAPGHPGDVSMPESGAVYTFRRSGAKWSQTSYIRAPTAEDYDQFGSGVALSADGKTLAVAASGEDSGARDTGALYVYSAR